MKRCGRAAKGLLLFCVMITLMCPGALADALIAPGDPVVIPEALQIDWDARYTFSELETQLTIIGDTYPEIAELYAIGHSWRERTLWCLELTDKTIAKEAKTGVAVLANIHGGERESAACAMYFAWWTALNADTEYVKDLLSKYVLYVVPVINPDGYEQSFVYNTRQNMRPRDQNGDGTPFSDPYADIDGDGFIARLYRGTADETPNARTSALFGMESPDYDKNGVLGDDPRNSGIDMNRTFDYQWNRFDIETKGSEAGVIGVNAWSSAGPDAASEPEVQAVQNFLVRNDIDALATLHTGIQCVLYPWCYRAYDETKAEDAAIPFMKETAAKMAAAWQGTTGRGCYTMSSYEDYPTSAELIDYAFGRLNIHAYTIEVYSGGKSKTGDIADCKWENDLPDEKWTFYTREQLAGMGLDVDALKDASGEPLGENEGLWFYTNASAQMVNAAPEDQKTMAKGTRDAILVMIESEPYGVGKQVPAYLEW